MSGNRIPTWVTLLLGGAALLAAAIGGLWTYMIATATPLHPDARAVPSVPGSTATGKWAGAAEETGRIVRATLAEENLPGLSVAAGAGGEILWAEGFGFADLEKRAPVTPQHRFRIGTASTVLTAAAAGLLLEDGRLKLDEPIQTYVPEFPRKQWPVTLRHLMGHVSGLPDDGGDEAPLLSRHCARSAEAVQFFAESALRFEPGTRFRTSSYGWILVSAAVEEAAEEPFLAFLDKRVFVPLAMRDTVPDSAPGRAESYFPRFSADPKYGPEPMSGVDYSCYSGASVFLSTPSDLVRFGMAVNNGKLLRPKTVRLLQTSQRLASGAETGYGLGWDLETVTLAGKPARAAGHDGTLLGGRAASLVTFPEHGLAVAVLANIAYADTFALAVRIAQVFADRGPAR